MILEWKRRPNSRCYRDFIKVMWRIYEQPLDQHMGTLRENVQVLRKDTTEQI